MRVVGGGYAMFVIGVLVSYSLIFPLTFRFLGTYQVSGYAANTGQSLYNSRHFAPAARQIVVVRPELRYVRILLARLFQSLRAAEPRT